MSTRWLTEILCEFDTYLWALFAGIVAGVAFGWPVGMALGVGFAALLYGIGRLAKKVIARSHRSTVPQRHVSTKATDRPTGC